MIGVKSIIINHIILVMFRKVVIKCYISLMLKLSVQMFVAIVVLYQKQHMTADVCNSNNLKQSFHRQVINCRFFYTFFNHFERI